MLLAVPQPTALLVPTSAPAIELEPVVIASGHVGVLPRVRRVRLGKDHAGRRARVWGDELTVHISLDGELVQERRVTLNADDM